MFTSQLVWFIDTKVSKVKKLIWFKKNQCFFSKIWIFAPISNTFEKFKKTRERNFLDRNRARIRVQNKKIHKPVNDHHDRKKNLGINWIFSKFATFDLNPMGFYMLHLRWSRSKMGWPIPKIFVGLFFLFKYASSDNTGKRNSKKWFFWNALIIIHL